MKKGVGLRCMSCATKGNEHRYLGKPYDKELYNSSMYQSWYNMKTRCTNKKSPSYYGYGARGITICEKWNTFSGFLDDMQDSYVKGLTIERINNNGNYEPSNCKWATKTEQARNTRNTERAMKITFNNETKTIREWAEEYGIKRRTLSNRIMYLGWSIEKSLGVSL